MTSSGCPRVESQTIAARPAAHRAEPGPDKRIVAEGVRSRWVRSSAARYISANAESLPQVGAEGELWAARKPALVNRRHKRTARMPDLERLNMRTIPVRIRLTDRA